MLLVAAGGSPSLKVKIHEAGHVREGLVAATVLVFVTLVSHQTCSEGPANPAGLT